MENISRNTTCSVKVHGFLPGPLILGSEHTELGNSCERLCIGKGLTVSPTSTQMMLAAAPLSHLGQIRNIPGIVQCLLGDKTVPSGEL